MNGEQLATKPDLTESQKIYLPVAKLNDAHHRHVAKMVQAYGRGDQQSAMQAQHYMGLIEMKLAQAYQRVWQYLLRRRGH
jgi:hypothetical protein